MTDQPERVLASEIIREKILRLMDKEIPHGIAVSIEKMKHDFDYQKRMDEIVSWGIGK